MQKKNLLKHSFCTILFPLFSVVNRASEGASERTCASFTCTCLQLRERAARCLLRSDMKTLSLPSFPFPSIERKREKIATAIALLRYLLTTDWVVVVVVVLSPPSSARTCNVLYRLAFQWKPCLRALYQTRRELVNRYVLYICYSCCQRLLYGL